MLDTHTLLWALLDHPRLSARARAHVADDDNEIIISAVSVLEITLKHRLGKLADATPFLRGNQLALDGIAFTPLSITFDHAGLAGALPILHKDPFDRLLIAQARVEGAALVSNEALFDGYGVTRIW